MPIRSETLRVATPVTLDKEEQVRRIAFVGAVLLVATAAAAAAATGGLPNIGTPSMKTEPVYKGYYDHHIDTYLITDVSSKSQAKAMHINYSAELKAVKGLPLQYFVRGRAAKGQLTVFGSEPGESDYNPLWEEVWVTWKAGVKPRAPRPGRPDQLPREEGQAHDEGRAHRPECTDPQGWEGRLIVPRKAEAAGKPAASKLRRRVVAVSPERESRRSSRGTVPAGLPLLGDLRRIRRKRPGQADCDSGTSARRGLTRESWYSSRSISSAGAGLPKR